MMLDKVEQANLQPDIFYYIIRVVLADGIVNRIEGYVAEFHGLVGCQGHEMIRCMNVHKGSKKYMLELFSPDNTVFYKMPSKIPVDTFIAEVLPFV